MYQVIARKYRPQGFDELISQQHVKTTIENAIAQHRIAHGYIFSGQRGTGKTTVARIFARCLNCAEGPTSKPCGVCSSCREIAEGSGVDVIEIDAASNRGINEMRELRESVRYRPARDRYKVFIIDEAHQITSEAFNALLKTLEEPPEWVVFILCTTESHKIPITIASRCQQFNFRSVDFNELIARMEWICKREGITADAEALSVLARAGEGSVRDSLSALDQAIACCGNTLSASDVRDLLGMFSLESLNRVTEALALPDAQQAGKAMLEVVAELEAGGRSLQHFARELARHVRNLLVAKIAGADTGLVAASSGEKQSMAAAASGFSEDDLARHLKITLDLFRDLQTSLQPRLHLEMGLLRLVHAGRLRSIEEAIAQVSGSGSPGAGGKSGGSPSESRGLKAGAPVPAASPQVAVQAAVTPPASAPLAGGGDLRSRIHAALIEAKRAFDADAIEHSTVRETPSEVVVHASKMYHLTLQNSEFENIVKKVVGRPVKISLKPPEEGAVQAAPVPIAKPTPEQDEATTRALEHPEVKLFQESFPGGQVRTVRNLRDQ